jgi:ABC-type lipoprotein export system ATPase subunit
VGERVIAPELIAGGGSIPVRSERACEVARWFGLRRWEGFEEDEKDSPRSHEAHEEGRRGRSLAPSPGSESGGTGGAGARRGQSKRKGNSGRASFSIPSIEPGTILLIRGASGAGKSSLLRRIRKRFLSEAQRTRRTKDNRDWARGMEDTPVGAAVNPWRFCPGTEKDFSAREGTPRVGAVWMDLDRIRFPRLPLVDCFGDELPLRDALSRLSRVGLSEAWSYLRLPAELSDGQRWRLRVALGLYQAQQQMRAGRSVVIACDEFTSLLDRITGAIVARCLRRAIDELNAAASGPVRAAAVVATAHDDLLGALRPDGVVRCDFGRIEVA